MKTLQHRFVEFIPEVLEEGTLYITVIYRTAVHLCICGCGNKVVTPFSPNDWKLIFDGRTVSLDPSIGNWNFECRSHYWIKKNEVHMAKNWTDYQVMTARKKNVKKKSK